MRKMIYLAALLASLILGLTLLELTRTETPREDAAMMLDAAERAQAAFHEVRLETERRGFAPDLRVDPNATGLIGPEYTDITTTLGDLEAKRTTTNPNMAGLIVRLFTEAGVQPGDLVAVNLSGSFPALNIATLCAMDAIGLEGLVISSVGASTYGATRPELTYLDLEDHLYGAGLIERRSDYFSLGGEGDIGADFPPELRGEITDRLTGLGYPLLYEADLEKNITARYDLYGQTGAVKCFVNVGGNMAASGTGSTLEVTARGVLLDISPGERGTGLIHRYLRAGVPVIQLLNVKGLATDYGLPVDPVPLPAVGEGDIYSRLAYQPYLLAGVTAWTLLLIGFGLWHVVRARRQRRSL